MTALLLTVAAASLLGSLHCAGMCGGFVAFYSGADPSRGPRRLLSHAAYNGGRVAGYTLLGAAAGLVGAALDLAGSLAGLQRVAALVAGTAMILWGVLALLQLRGVRLLGGRGSGVAGAWLRRGFSVVSRRPPLLRALLVGLLSGLLPCGWLWAFLVTAAGTGSALRGAAVMMVFWLGTVPVLLAIGLGAQLVGAPLRRHVPSLTAVLLVALGILAVVGRPPEVAAAVAQRQEQRTRDTATEVPELEHTELPCCEQD
jgi:sulfite exporter TauE/SafE